MIKKLILIVAVLISFNVLADSRVCSSTKNTRSPKAVAEFKKLYPCPDTKLPGACPRWEVDHIIPLACGGCDSIENMQWLKSSIKSCAGTECKDRWERKVYCPK